jgi:uncharacterized spore protein YtfJ
MATVALQQTLREAIEAIRADAVFGRPVERGETTIVPCAEVMVGMGMGGGGGRGRTSASETERETSVGEGEGVGGGGGGRGRPIAAIVITRDGVRVEPILDVTKVVLASITTGAFMAIWLARLGIGRRGLRAKTPALRRLTRELKA